MSILKELVNALIETAYDRQDSVKQAISSALIDIGRTKPDVALIQIIEYLHHHPKLNRQHRILLLTNLNKIMELHLDSLSAEMYTAIIQLGTNEMSMTSEIVPEWQTAASTVLVTSGLRYPEEVAQKLLEKMSTGNIPHFFTIQTLGQLANANSKVVPLVKREAVLGRMLPMMGAVKQDNMKWAFATCVGSLCEAVLNYTGDREEAVKRGISRSDFSGEVYSAYDILFNVWINSKESKLRLAIMDALGHMAALLATETLQEQSARLFNGILGLYRKNQEHYYITQCLGYVISAAQDKDIPLDVHLEVLLSTLYQYACQPVDLSNQMALKNRNEVWRTCEIISRKNSDRIVGFLLTKLEQPGEKNRLGAMDILRHLINAADEVLEDKKPMILNGLKITCQDPSLRVRRGLLMIVKAMAHKDYLCLEGGQIMVQFMVQQASLPPDLVKDKKTSDADSPTNSELRSIAENMLFLMTTTLPQMTAVFWPFLLEFLLPLSCTEGTGAVCQSLAYIAANKRDNAEEDFDLDYETMVNLPKPQQLLARLLMLSGVPIKQRDGHTEVRGLHMLKLMKAISPNIHEDLVSLWDAVIPKLISQLSDPQTLTSFSQKTWEDLIMKLLSRSLDELEDEEWLLGLGKELSEQCMPLYAESSEEKAVLYKCMGVILRKTTNKLFLHEQLTIMFNTVRHTKPVEREGLACGFGISAASHLDTVLEKLEQISSQEMVRKSTGLFGLSKDKSEGDVERIKSTVMLCYGYSSLYAPPALIPSRIEVTIIRSINPHFSNIKDPAVKQSLIKTIELIGRSLHPSHLGDTLFEFTHRKDLIKHLLTFIRQESKAYISTDTRSLCIQALSTLIKLDPPLQPAEQAELVGTVLDQVISLPDTTQMTPSKKEVSSATAEELLTEVLKEINGLLRELLIKRLYTDTLIELFRDFLPYFSQPHPLKTRAASLWNQVLFQYHENLTQVMEEEGNQRPSPSSPSDQTPFSCLPELLGYMVPKSTDPLLSVRVNCLRSIQLLLLINNRYLGINPDLKDQFIEALSILIGRAENEEGLFNLASDLGKVLAKKLPDSMVLTFIGVTTEGLMDAEMSSASGAVVVLNQTLKVRGQQLPDALPHIMDSLLQQLSKMSAGQNRTGTLRCIRTFSSYHLPLIVNYLLDKSSQMSIDLVESWQCLAREPSLAKPLLDLLMDTLDRSLPYQEKKEGAVVKILSTPKPGAVVAVFSHLFPLDEMEGLIQEHYPRLFSQMMTRIGVCALMEGQAGTKSKGAKDSQTPIQQCLSAFHALLTAAKQDAVLSYMDSQSYWTLLEGPTYPEGITELARAFSQHSSGFIPKTVHVLNSALSSIYDPFRIVSTAFFAELINQQAVGVVPQKEGQEGVQKDLVEQLINSLLGRLVDSHYTVRMLCIRGLGNIASHNQKLVQTFSTTVLSAMMSGMDDKEDPDDYITMEAMNGLSKIIAKIDEGHVRPILVNIILRIRPCFQKHLPGVRTAAFTLFGDLSQFGDGPSKDPYLEQIFSNLVTLLVHMNENEQSVVCSCKQTLCKIGPLIGNEEVNQIFQKYLDPQKQIIYGEFLDILTKKMVFAFPDKLNYFTLSATLFFKSCWQEIRANAALLVGFMLHHIPENLQEGISKEQVSEALIGLLHDTTPEVRISCANAISLLANY